MSAHPLPYRQYPSQNKGGSPYAHVSDRGATIQRPSTRQQRGYGEVYDDGYRGGDGIRLGIGNDDLNNPRGTDPSQQYQSPPSKQGQYRDRPPRNPELRTAQTFAGETRYYDQRTLQHHNTRGLPQHASQKQRAPMQALDLASKPEPLRPGRADAHDYKALVSPIHDRFHNYPRSGHDYEPHHRSHFPDQERVKGRGNVMHPAQLDMQPLPKRNILYRAQSAPPDDPRNIKQEREGGDQYGYPTRWPPQQRNGNGPSMSYRELRAAGGSNDQTIVPPNGRSFIPEPVLHYQDENVPQRSSGDRTQGVRHLPPGSKLPYDTRIRTTDGRMIPSTEKEFLEDGNGHTVRGASFGVDRSQSYKQHFPSQYSSPVSSHIGSGRSTTIGKDVEDTISGSHSSEIETSLPGSVDDLLDDYLEELGSPNAENNLARMMIEGDVHGRMGPRSERRDTNESETPRVGYERTAPVYDRRGGYGRGDPSIDDRKGTDRGQMQHRPVLGQGTDPRMGSMAAPASRDVYAQPQRPGINNPGLLNVTSPTSDPKPNPNALPYHPPPFRENSESPADATADGSSESQNRAKPFKSAGPPLEGAPKHRERITFARLEQERRDVANNPADPEIQMNFAKTLLEASIVLAGEDGRADPKKTVKNRDMYIAEAQKIVKKLAAMGSTGLGKPPYPAAVFFLATCYGDGNMGMQVDHEKAFNLYHSAAKQGDSASCYRTAMCCEMGVGTRRDPTKAMQFYRKAASLGDVGSMYKLGMIMLRGLLGLPQNTREGITWLTKAVDNANEENPHAVHTLATLYERPDDSLAGIISIDSTKALELYSKAAHLGHASAQFRLGCAYEYGQLGCPVDSRKSIAWYSRAAAAGEPDSELALSGWYLTGAEGVLAQSDHEAYLWARKAADRGLAKAEFAVGYYVETGIGTEKDLTEAKKWYLRAAEQGQKRAMARLAELKKAPQISGNGTDGAAGSGGREKQALQKHRGEGKGGKDADCSIM